MTEETNWSELSDEALLERARQVFQELSDYDAAEDLSRPPSRQESQQDMEQRIRDRTHMLAGLSASIEKREEYEQRFWPVLRGLRDECDRRGLEPASAHKYRGAYVNDTVRSMVLADLGRIIGDLEERIRTRSP